MHGAKRRAALDSPARAADEKGQTNTTGECIVKNKPWEIEKIIEVARQLKATGSTPGSTGERIAAAFVLNRMDYLPDCYSDAVEAWDRLDLEWQQYVRIVKEDYMYLIEAE